MLQSLQTITTAQDGTWASAIEGEKNDKICPEYRPISDADKHSN